MDSNHFRYRIKQIPEDFIVTEKTKIVSNPLGKYTYLILKKKGHTTLKAVLAVARTLRIDSKRIGFCGNKDRQAVTTQAISINNLDPVMLSGLEIPGIEVQYLGKGDVPLRLGDLEGNIFKITLREVGFRPVLLRCFINYYGSQRFGRHNAAVGRALVKRKYVEAITLICESSPDFAENLHSFIGAQPSNPIGALRLLPKTLLMLYVHSYQAGLWNETVDKYLSAGGTAQEAPLIGFSMKYPDTIMEGIIKEIVIREGLTFRDFIFRDLPELSAEGGSRKIYIEVEDLRVGDLEKNELGLNSKLIVEFSLPPGSYATVFIDQLFEAKA